MTFRFRNNGFRESTTPCSGPTRRCPTSTQLPHRLITRQQSFKNFDESDLKTICIVLESSPAYYPILT